MFIDNKLPWKYRLLNALPWRQTTISYGSRWEEDLPRQINLTMADFAVVQIAAALLPYLADEELKPKNWGFGEPLTQINVDHAGWAGERSFRVHLGAFTEHATHLEVRLHQDDGEFVFTFVLRQSCNPAYTREKVWSGDGVISSTGQATINYISKPTEHNLAAA